MFKNFFLRKNYDESGILTELFFQQLTDDYSHFNFLIISYILGGNANRDNSNKLVFYENIMLMFVTSILISNSLRRYQKNIP